MMRSMVCCHENLYGLPFVPSAAIVADAALMLVLSVADLVLDKERARVMLGAARRIKKAVVRGGEVLGKKKDQISAAYYTRTWTWDKYEDYDGRKRIKQH